MDETYLKVAGTWRYLYRAIDQFGQVVDVFLSSQRHAGAARRFFTKAMADNQSEPAEVITDRARGLPERPRRTAPRRPPRRGAVRQQRARGRPRATEGPPASDARAEDHGERAARLQWSRLRQNLRRAITSLGSTFPGGVDSPRRSPSSPTQSGDPRDGGFTAPRMKQRNSAGLT